MASRDQDPTIIQQCGRVTTPIPVRGHIAGIAERAGDGIIEFGAVNGLIEGFPVAGHEPTAPSDQDPAIGEQGSGVVTPSRAHAHSSSEYFG